MSIMEGLPPEGCACSPSPCPFWLRANRKPSGQSPSVGLWGLAHGGSVGQWSRAGMGHLLCLPSLHPHLQVSR